MPAGLILSSGKMMYSLFALAVEPETRMQEFRILVWPGVKKPLLALETRILINGCMSMIQVVKRADRRLPINPDFAFKMRKNLIRSNPSSYSLE
jgi:hypothetical protein